MPRAVLALLMVTLALAGAGCSGPGPATYRFAGQLDRALTAGEQEEVRDLAGKDFNVESTDIGCPPEVDPYDCNQHWLRVDEITEGRCDRMVDRLAARTYWRVAPRCDQPPGY